MFGQMNEVHFNDIIAGVSLFRPGPMAFIPRYISVKNGYSDPDYLFPELKPILEETYGVIVYQEQILRIAIELAGYSEGASDLFRRAIGKKDKKLIEQQIGVLVYGQKEDQEKGLKYIPGLVKNGIPEYLALQLGDAMVDFGKYSFNKSHAAAYAVVCMWTAYMKTHHFLEYMAPLISSYMGKDDKRIVQYMNNVKSKGHKVLPPDINNSEYEFELEGNDLRYGLGGIKGLNKAAVAIITEREKNGPFKDLEDFISRFNKSQVNKKALDVLSLSGTMQSISPHSDRLDTLRKLYEFRGDTVPGDILTKYLDQTESASMSKAKQMYSKLFKDNFEVEMYILDLEQALLGAYISGHPLEGKAEPTSWESIGNTDRFDVVGIINNTKVIKTKRGDSMAFIDLETLEGMKSFTLFPGDYELQKNKIEKGGLRVLTAEARLRKDDPGVLSYIVKNIKYFRDTNASKGETQE